MTDAQRNFLIIIGLSLAAVVLWPLAVGIGIANYLVNAAFVILIGATLLVLHNRNSSEISRMKLPWKLLLLGSGMVGYIFYFTGSLWPGWALGADPMTKTLFWAVNIMFVVAMYTAWQRRYE
jgi:hypothetical protein